MYHHTDWIMVLSLRRDVVVCLFYIFKLLQETLFLHYDIAFNDIKVWTGYNSSFPFNIYVLPKLQRIEMK